MLFNKLFNKLLLSLLFLNVSLNNFALETNDNISTEYETQECDNAECSLNSLFSLENMLADSEVRDFYNTLSESEKTDFASLIKELNIVSSDILTKLVGILQKYEALVTKFRETNNYENLNMVITFTSTDLTGFAKSLDNSKFKEFVSAVSEEEKNEFTQLCQEMRDCFENGTAALANLFNSSVAITSKYKDSTKKDILIVVGFDQDDALPCQYSVI